MGGIVAAATGSVAAQAAEPGSPAAGVPVLPLAAAVLVAAVCLVVLWKLDTIRPGSLARRDQPAPEPQAAVPLALMAFGVYLLPAVLTAVLLGALAIELAAQPNLRDNGIVASLSYGTGVAVSVIACWLAIRWKLLRPASVLPRVRDLWVGVAAIALSYPVMHATSQLAYAAVTLSGGDAGAGLQHGTLKLLAEGDRASPWWWAVVAGAVLGAPIVEEVVFRGLLQPALRAVLGPWPAVLIAGALFTLLHVPRGPDSGGATWLAIPTLAVLALALGIARERTGRLGVPIAMHIAFNALNVALALFVSRG